jgi:hypothetical protein
LTGSQRALARMALQKMGDSLSTTEIDV